MSCYFVQYTDSQGTTVPPETDIDTDKNDIKGLIIILKFSSCKGSCLISAIFSITLIFLGKEYIIYYSTPFFVLICIFNICKVKYIH